MMSRAHASLLAAALAAGLAWAGLAWCQDPAPAVAEAPWLQSITQPLAIGDAEGVALCQALHEGLRQGRVPATGIAGLPGADRPRAIALSWSDGRSAARTCFGMGPDAASALEQACRKALESTPSPRGLRWLKVDIVQRGQAVSNFSPRQSRLPLPSLIGLSFGPVAGFDFLPEQLMAWEMVDPSGQLRVHAISERVLGQEVGRYRSTTERLQDLGRWTAITSFTGGQRVCLFETASFGHDGTQAWPLFRGHRLYENVTAAELRGMALEVGERLLGMCGPDGLFASALPEWELGKTQGAMPRDYALALLALVRLHQATGEAGYLKAAERVAPRLVSAVRRYGRAPVAGCLPEMQDLPGSQGVVAQAQITSTLTNALAVVALCELSEALRSEAYHPALALLAQHLILQLQPGGTVVSAREFPSLDLCPELGGEASGAVLLAMASLYGSAAREAFLGHAQALAGGLLQHRLQPAGMDDLPRDAWLLEGLDRLFTFSRDEALVASAERLALAALLDQSRDAAFPDGYGAVAGDVSACAAADRSRLLAVAARLLHDRGRSEAAAALLAEVRPYVLFQLQSRLTPAEVLYLATPADYLGLFRDHVLDIGIDLRGQATQVLSLLALSGELQRRGLDAFPADLAVERTLAAARARPADSTGFLTPGLAASAAMEGPGQVIQFRDVSQGILTIRPRGAKGGPGDDGSPFVPVRPVEPGQTTPPPGRTGRPARR